MTVPGYVRVCLIAATPPEKTAKTDFGADKAEKRTVAKPVQRSVCRSARR
jgi:hypothetical protein